MNRAFPKETEIKCRNTFTKNYLHASMQPYNIFMPPPPNVFKLKEILCSQHFHNTFTTNLK